MAGVMGAEMTRGTHPFDLAIGKNVIDVIILPPDELDDEENKDVKR